MKNNQKGFGLVEGLLMLVIVGIIGGVGYFVYNSQKQTDKSLVDASKASSSASVSTKKSKDETQSNTTKQTVAFKGAKFTFDLPKGWKYSGAVETGAHGDPTEMDQYNAYVSDPNNKLQLSMLIQNKADWAGYSASAGPYQASFTGIGGKTYYLEEVSTNGSNVNQLSVSACGPNACKTLDDHTTKLNDTYWLNLAINPGSDETPPFKLSVNDPFVTQIKAIISSITIE